jgi:hypothetical protein
MYKDKFVMKKYYTDKNIKLTDTLDKFVISTIFLIV